MQIHLPSILLFAAAANMDSFLIGLSYGLKKIRINGKINNIVGIITAIGTALSMLFGQGILTLFPFGSANAAGGLLILGIGLAGFLRFALPQESNPVSNQENRESDQKLTRESGQKADLKSKSDTGGKTLTIRQVVWLSLALTVNNIALGVGASFTGMHVLSTTLCSFLISVLFLYSGNTIGYQSILPLHARYAEGLANLMIVLLGLYEMLI